MAPAVSCWLCIAPMGVSTVTATRNRIWKASGLMPIQLLCAGIAKFAGTSADLLSSSSTNYIRTYMGACLHACMFRYIHIYINTYIHTYIYILCIYIYVIVCIYTIHTDTQEMRAHTMTYSNVLGRYCWFWILVYGGPLVLVHEFLAEGSGYIDS